jgi:uncharacterized repeat protein (TIGR02543 family)
MDAVTGDITLKVVWSDSEYTVSFIDTLPGSGGGALTAKKVKYGDIYPALPVRTAVGYTFGGWYTQPTGGDIVVTGMPMHTPNNHTLYARWTRLSYDVVFQEKDSGKHMGTQTVAYEGRAAQPAGIDRAGYSYAWEKDGSPFSFSSPITGDTTLELVWTARAYTVTRNLNYPSAPSASPLTGSVTYAAEYGDMITSEPADRPGQVFTGWYTQAVDGDRVTASTVYNSPAPANHTLFAHWGSDGTTYTVTFMDPENPGGFVVHQKALGGDRIASPAVTPQAGKKVVWKDGGTAWNFATDTVAGDLTLTAEWVAAEYTVKFDTNGHGSVASSSITVTYGDEYGVLPTPDSVVGYTFDAWYTRGDAGGEKVSRYDAVPPKNHTLYARWIADKYIVKYNLGYADAATLADGEVSFDGRFSALPKPDREGYAFIGWFNKLKENEPFDGVQIETDSRFDYSVTVPVGDPKTIMLYAGWAVVDDGGSGGDGGGTPGVYTVTFDANGGTVSQESAVTDETGKLATLPTPTHNVYRFVGWFTDKLIGDNVTTDTVFTGAAIIYAHWMVAGSGIIGFNGGISGGGSTGGGGGGGSGGSGITGASGGITTVSVGGIDDKAMTDAIKTEADKDASLKSGSSSSAALYISEKIRETLETAEHKKFVNGYGDKTLRPNNPITRAEAAAIFFRLIKDANKESVSITNMFPDVIENSWYANSVKYLANAGVLTGYYDGAFRPEQNITRAEFTALASRFDDMRTDVEDAFVDVSNKHWAHGYILSAYAKGWISGYPGDIFLPENAITRAEVVTIVNRMLGRRLKFEDVDPKYRTLYSDLTVAHWAFADMIEASVDHGYERAEDTYEVWQ